MSERTKPSGSATSAGVPDGAPGQPPTPARTRRPARKPWREIVMGWSTWLWAVGGLVAALLLWWPFSYLGVADFMHLPALPAQLGVVLVGAFAASGVTAILVRSPWPRFVIAIAFPLVCLSRSGGPGPHAVTVVLCLLVVVLIGLAVGAYGTGSTMAFAGSLAFIVGAAPGTLWKGPFIALALALPFARATLNRVAPTIFGILGVLALWLLGTVVSHGLVGGFGTQSVQSAVGIDIVKEGLKESFSVARADAAFLAQGAFQAMTGWFVVAALLAALIVVVRVVAHRRRPG